MKALNDHSEYIKPIDYFEDLGLDKEKEIVKIYVAIYTEKGKKLSETTIS